MYVCHASVPARGPVSVPQHPYEGQRVSGHHDPRLRVAEHAQLFPRALTPAYVHCASASSRRAIEGHMIQIFKLRAKQLGLLPNQISYQEDFNGERSEFVSYFNIILFYLSIELRSSWYFKTGD